MNRHLFSANLSSAPSLLLARGGDTAAMEAMQIAGPSYPEEPTTMGMPEGDRLLPPKKRAGLTAPESALEVLKKAKVEAGTDADSDSDNCRFQELVSDWVRHWNELMARENTEDQTVEDEEWLPEGVHWTYDTRYDDDYQSLVVYDGCHLYENKYESGIFMLENEEQQAYLKFYYQLCKEVKLGADHDECAEKAYSLTGDVSDSLRSLAILDRMDDLKAELEVNIRNSVYCYLWDEVILKKRVYASVTAEIEEKYPMHGERINIMEDASGNCFAKLFLKELEDRIDVSMTSEEAHEQVKKACDEEWPMKYVTFASYLELKMMVAEKLGVLPKELQGLLQELHGGAEN